MKPCLRKGFFSLGIGISLAMISVAEAGVMLLQPPPPPPPGVYEKFPESSFGRPPTRPNIAGAVDEMDGVEQEDRSPYASRRPAGTEQAAEPTAAASDTMLIPQSAVARKGVQEVALIANDLGFFPKTLFVSRDVPVRLFVTGASKNPLCIMMDAFQIRKQVRSQKVEEITFTPNVPGKYRFYCPVNGMEGNLVVKEFTSTQITGTEP